MSSCALGLGVGERWAAGALGEGGWALLSLGPSLLLSHPSHTGHTQPVLTLTLNDGGGGEHGVHLRDELYFLELVCLRFRVDLFGTLLKTWCPA